jgi:phage tail sheath protein FI
MYFPWVYRPTAVTGVNRAIPPLGYAAGARARAHNQVGPAQPGAGIVSNARFINGVEVDIDKATGDTLDGAYVNAIRTINNTIRVYGARSLSADTANFRYYTGQDIVNHVVVEANRSLEDLLFSVIDGRNNIFASVEAKLIAILEPLRVSGALYEAFDENGKRIDYGYTVKCDASLNPTTQLADGLIKAKVGMRVSSVGDKIEVDIVKSNLTASVV